MQKQDQIPTVAVRWRRFISKEAWSLVQGSELPLHLQRQQSIKAKPKGSVVSGSGFKSRLLHCQAGWCWAN